jgi:hypothetical protein
MNKSLSFLLLFSFAPFLFFLPAIAASARDGAPYDYWLRIERNRHPYSWVHSTRTVRPGGGYMYDSTTTLKVNTLGVNDEDQSYVAHFEVGADFAPLAFTYRTSSNVKDVVAGGTVEDGVLRYSSKTHDGGRKTGEIEASMAWHERTGEVVMKDAVFDVCLSDLALVEKLRSREVEIFDADMLATKKTRLDLLSRTEDIVRYETTDELTARYDIDKDGRIMKFEILELSVNGFETCEIEAKKIGYLKTDDGFTLTINSSKPLINTLRISKATLKLAWKRIPIESFDFSDERQTPIEFKHDGDSYEVTLFFTRLLENSGDTGISEPAPLSKAAPEHGELAKYLSDSDEFITPSSPLVKKTLNEILARKIDLSMNGRKVASATGATREVEIVEKILAWTRSSISTELIAETLSADEVIRQRKGKCSEFAIAFASLARTAGVPTKIALGDRHCGGTTWFGHMWNEVSINGRWFGVDAGDGSWISGPTHIKFISSDNVRGTQDIRYKLVDNLAIDVASLDEETNEATSKLVTGIDGLVYTNKSFACSIAAPSATWTMTREISLIAETLLIQLPASETSYEHARRKTAAQNGTVPPKAIFALVLLPTTPDTPARLILDARLGAISKTVSQYRLLETGSVEILNLKAEKAVFVHARKDKSVVANENIVLITDSGGYLFVFITDEKDRVAMKGKFEEILASFRLYR